MGGGGRGRVQVIKKPLRVLVRPAEEPSLKNIVFLRGDCRAMGGSGDKYSSLYF